LLSGYRSTFHYHRQVPVLLPGVAEGFDRVGDLLQPRFSAKGAPAASAGLVTVALPARADGRFHLHHPASSATLDVALEGAAPAEAELADGYAVYPGAYRGADILHRVTESGTEDFIAFMQPPTTSEVVYRIDLDPSIAGMRQVGSVLEMLDARGVPRLRVNEPYLVGADSTRTAATLTVEGCAVDHDTAQPYGRKVTPPGAASCRVHIAWSDQVSFPAILDPSWTSTTNNLVAGRARHTATVLNNGTVLLVGGVDVNGTSILDAEIFTPDGMGNGTFSPTVALNTARVGHTATKLSDGRVLIAGGHVEFINNVDQVVYLVVRSDASLYSADGSNRVTVNAALPSPKSVHAAVLMQGGPDDGRVLLCGGDDGGAVPLLQSPTKNCFAYDPTNDNFVNKTDLSHATLYSLLLRISGGPKDGEYVSLAGYDVGPDVNKPAVDILDAAAANIDQTDLTAPVGFDHPRAVTLTGGKVLIASDYFSNSLNGADGQILDTGAAINSAGRYKAVPMIHQHSLHAITTLQNGTVLVSGDSAAGPLNDYQTETFDPSNNKWTDLSIIAPLTPGRYNHSASLLQNGQVLAAGGNGQGTISLGTLFVVQSANGTACNGDGDCASGHCIHPSCLGPGDTSCGAGSCVGTTCTNNGVCCGSSNCDDASPCTIDSCTGGSCINVNRAACFMNVAQCGLPSQGTFPAVSVCYGNNKPWSDTDGDGLSDAWEQNGYIDVNCNGTNDGNDIAIPNPSPNTKDLYIKYDYMATGMHSHQPPNAALNQVKDAFAAHNITLHWIAPGASITEHQVVTRDVMATASCAGADFVNTQQLRAASIGTLGGVLNSHFKHPFLHYLVFAHNATLPDTALDGSACPIDPECGGHPDPTNSGSADIFGDDIIVAFGYNVDLSIPIGIETWAGTTMHEIGHNLGLKHGSLAAPAPQTCYLNKPNFISVMDYSYQSGIGVSTASGNASAMTCVSDANCSTGVCATPNACHCTDDLAPNTCYRVDYSNNTLLTLNELALNESLGVGGPAGDQDLVVYCAQGLGCALSGPTVGAINWNNMDGSTESNVSADIAGTGASNLLLDTTTDWNNTSFGFQCSSSWGSGAPGDDPSSGTDELGLANARNQHFLYPPFTATIDIRPGCGTNWIAIGGPGDVPVAVFGTPTFAVSSVDVATLHLDGVPADGTSTTDVDNDGIQDLLATFPMASLPVTQSTTSLTLSGAQTNSRAFTGVAPVTIVAQAGPVVTIHNDGTGYSQTLGPPNNKSWVTYHLSDCVDSVVDNCGNPLSIDGIGQITKITSDEVCPADMAILGNSTFEVRRDRDGNGDGRVYTAWFTVADSYGDVTTASCKVQMKHDNAHNATDSGAHSCVGSCL
jgi:hypothetical protein